MIFFKEVASTINLKLKMLSETELGINIIFILIILQEEKNFLFEIINISISTFFINYYSPNSFCIHFFLHFIY